MGADRRRPAGRAPRLRSGLPPRIAAVALARVGERGGALETLDVSILGPIEPDGVAPALQRGGDGLAARFLYAWPHAAPFCPLAERKRPGRSELLMAPLRRLLRLVPVSRERRCILLFDDPGEKAFNAFLARLHAEVQRAERP